MADRNPAYVLDWGVGWMVKRSLDKIERKLDSAATKAELEKEVGECKQQISEIQHTYTTRSQHQQDWTECHNDIKAIQRNFLTKEDYFREQAKTEKKLDQILNLLMKGRLSDE